MNFHSQYIQYRRPSSLQISCKWKNLPAYEKKTELYYLNTHFYKQTLFPHPAIIDSQQARPEFVQKKIAGRVLFTSFSLNTIYRQKIFYPETLCSFSFFFFLKILISSARGIRTPTIPRPRRIIERYSESSCSSSCSSLFI